MPTYQHFSFDSYALDLDARTIKLHYSFDDEIHFTETFTLPADVPFRLDHPDLDAALFALHLSGGASYYKAYCPPVIEVKSGQLNAEQAEFWNNLYTYGLGQFFYENQLDFRGLVQFPVTSAQPAAPAPSQPHIPKRALVPFGGGKDSIVTTELLRTAGVEQTLFRLRGHHLITKLAGIAELPLLEVGRTLDPQIIALNKAGAYNGHVPITAHISCLTVVIGLLTGYDSVFFSNERSSSYGNVEYLGMEINHQWSKGLEFETAFQDYVGRYITPSFQYLNMLRPVSEIHIAKLFTGYPQYFGAATSCNANWVLSERSPDEPRWCGTCPKCTFSFSLFAAFLPREQAVMLVGHNPFDNPDLIPLYRELWGVEGFKPFECVGTPEEAQAACYLAHKQGGYDNTPVMKEFITNVLPALTSPEVLIKDLLTPDSTITSPVTRSLLEANHLI